VSAFIDSCGPEWAGLSLTMPLKTAVLPLLDQMSTTSEVTGAANTVVFTDGLRRGDNTDVAGMVAALREAKPAEFSADRVLILGGGATARSAVAAAAQLGATRIEAVVRSRQRAMDLAEVGDRVGVAVALRTWDEGVSFVDAPVVISTVPYGAADALAEDVPEGPGVLLDVAYGAAPTRLGQSWRGAGGTMADGLDLLLWQAVDQVRLMTGAEPPVEAMRAALRARA